MVAKLCQLGYDLVLDDDEKHHPFDSFYHVTFSPRGFSSEYTFATGDSYIGWYNELDGPNFGIRRPDFEDVETEEWVHSDVFAEYAIYLWGLSRGGRWPFETQKQLITMQHIRDWDLVSLI